MTHSEWRALRRTPPTQPLPPVPVSPAPLAPPKKSGVDSDRLLVFALALVLWQNGASIELILALVYIAM